MFYVCTFWTLLPLTNCAAPCPPKLCSRRVAAGAGVVLRRVIVSILKSALILILELNRSENIKEQRDYTVLCIVGWFSADIVSMTRALHSTQVENAGKYEDIVATFLRYDQQWKHATVISYTRTHPLVTGSRGPILELFLTDHPQPTGRHQHKSLD